VRTLISTEKVRGPRWKVAGLLQVHLLVFWGCGEAKPAVRAFDRIEAGMSMEQISALLGAPSLAEDSPFRTLTGFCPLVSRRALLFQDEPGDLGLIVCFDASGVVLETSSASPHH
jgi:hypothetical protein